MHEDMYAIECFTLAMTAVLCTFVQSDLQMFICTPAVCNACDYSQLADEWSRVDWVFSATEKSCNNNTIIILMFFLKSAIFANEVQFRVSVPVDTEKKLHLENDKGDCVYFDFVH